MPRQEIPHQYATGSTGRWGEPHAWICSQGGRALYEFAAPTRLREITLVFDSGMKQLVASIFQEGFSSLTRMPPGMPRDFRLEVQREGDRAVVRPVLDNHQPHVRLPVDVKRMGVRFVLERTWAATQPRVYGFYVE